MSVWSEIEAAKVLNDVDLIEDAICTIYDTAAETKDIKTIRRMRSTYPAVFLERVINLEELGIADETTEEGEA